MRIGLNKVDRCRLKCHFCLHSKTNNIKIQKFSFKNFVSYVDRLVRLGFDEIDLTPNMGDVFDDYDVLDKLEFLSKYRDINKYCFATNFLSVKEEHLYHIIYNSLMERIWVDISVYGWNRESYRETTGTDNYDLFVSNLRSILELCKPIQINKPLRRINLYMRCGVTYENFPDGEVKELLRTAVDLYGAMYENTELDNSNWGGLINQGYDAWHTKGICVHAIHDNGVFPDGRVSLCSCWDTYGELVFGNIYDKNPYENQEYEEMLVCMATGKYKNICKNCNDFYEASRSDLVGYKYAEKFWVLVDE